PSESFGGEPTALPEGDENRLIAHQGREPGDGPGGPFVEFGGPAPQGGLFTPVGPDLDRLETQADDPGGGAAVAHPPGELPAHPFDHGGGIESPGPMPGPGVDLVMIGLGGDGEAGAEPTVGTEGGGEIVGQG